MTTVTKTITIRRDVAAEAQADAAAERERLARRGTLVVNLLSSPGSGKTTLLEATARHLAGRHSMAVLVGDLETDRDARRLSPLVPTAQLTTGGACHLELPLVRRGLDALGDPQVDFLFIENIGNLVCPASHDLAEHLRVVLLRLFPVREDVARPVTVLLIENRARFSSLIPRERARGEALGGFFQGGDERDYAVLHLSPLEARPFEAAEHELAHLILNSSLPAQPLWVAEGLADLVSDAVLEGDEARLGAARDL